MSKIKIPKEYREYKWIAKRFINIDNVKKVVVEEDEDGLTLFADNKKDGDKKKVFRFPLRRLMFLDYANAQNVPSTYDVMGIDNPENMVFLGECKAKQFFKEQ